MVITAIPQLVPFPPFQYPPETLAGSVLSSPTPTQIFQELLSASSKESMWNLNWCLPEEKPVAARITPHLDRIEKLKSKSERLMKIYSFFLAVVLLEGARETVAPIVKSSSEP